MNLGNQKQGNPNRAMLKRSKQPLSGKTILLCLSGSIALYRACDLLRDLRREGAEVFCVMTKGAQQFVTPLTFQTLSAHPVYTDMFAANVDWNVLHTSLADRASLILICPASANLIARLAAGMADDLVVSSVLASKAKVLIVPAMNDNMYAHPATQTNVKTLKERGCEFVDPVRGELACGREGVGHIAENAVIMKRVQSLLLK